MRTLRFIGFFVCIFYSAKLQAQSDEMSFARYLIEKKNYDEAIFVLHSMGHARGSTRGQQDSVHFLLGNIFYRQQKLQRSIEQFDSVSGRWPRLHSEAVFFSAYNNVYLKSYSTAKEKMIRFPQQDSVLNQLRNFELAGIALLQRNLPTYDSLSNLFSPVNYSMDEQEIRLKEHYDRIIHQPKRSLLVAGLLSAIVPGAGRFYAGNKGQGIYTFLIAAVIGSQAWEGYQTDGPSSVRFIAYATIFTSFYVGTIWGSVFTVKMKRDQLNETINNQILIDLHIPIRTIFR